MTDEQASNFVEDSRQSQRQDAETITDICYRDSGSEIHMVSLLEERIPRYTLRSDALTNFAGYDNEDYAIRNPCFQGEFDPDLSVELIEETLKYFIMGGARISQITKTFDDSRALTLLLEEKERDLEISAELGNILIERVRRLEKTVVRRTQENEKLKAQISNLQRELTLRDSLLRVHVKDFDSDAESEDDEKCITECSSLKLTAVHVENLRTKVKTLQSENDQMASSVQRIATEMGEGQDREENLVTTCIDNLLQMNYSILFLREELDAKMELIARQQEEIGSYSEQILVVEAKAKKVSGELRRASRKLTEAETQQQTAIAEMEGWKERYTECWNLLEAANDELKSLRKAQSKTASVIHRNYSSSSVSLSPFLPMGSLASELHDSQKKDLFYHLGYSPSATKQHSRRVMDVAKAVARISARRCLVSSEDQIYTGGTGGAGEDDGDSATADEDDGISNGDSLESQCGSLGHAGSDDDISDSELNDTDRSDWSQKQKVLFDFNHLSLGQPGIPGSNDLEVALMRLNSPTMFSSPNAAPNSCLSLPDDTQSKESLSPLPPHLSTEVRSRNSSATNLSEANSFTFAKPKIPEKLQIVKPLEGSITLNHWKSLGIPNLQGLLESRPGVQTKDQPPVQLFHDESEVFSLSDYEEDSTPPSNRADDRITTVDKKTSDENSRFSDKSSSRRADDSTNVKNAEKLSAGNADGRLRYIDDCQTTMMTLPDIVTSEKRTFDSKETTTTTTATTTATTTSKRFQSCAFM